MPFRDAGFRAADLSRQEGWEAGRADRPRRRRAFPDRAQDARGRGRPESRAAAGPGGTVVVANGAESEPASGKDRLLLARAPHLVLDGIALAAEAVGATRGYLSLDERQDELALQLAAAIDERERAGQNRVPVQILGVPAGYVASQETAVIGQLNGGAAKPAFVPPRHSRRARTGGPRWCRMSRPWPTWP